MMPGYHGEGEGGERYRGRGRGGYGWGRREGGGGGGRGGYSHRGGGGGGYSHRGGGGGGYSHRGGGGGGRYGGGGDKHRWGDGGGGGREGGSRPYKDYNTYRFRDGPTTSQGMNPWQGGGGGGGHKRGGGGGGGGMEATDLLRSLTEYGHISSKESRIAIDILKSVLSSDSGSGSRDGWDGPPARKMRRMEWGGAGRSSPPPYKYRDRPYVARRSQEHRGRGRPRLDYRKLSHSQLKEMKMARFEMPQPEKKELKDQDKKSTEDKKVREGDEEKKEGEKKEGATGGSSAQDGKQSETEERKEEKDGEKKEEKKKPDEAQPDSQNFFPRSALKCHMCDMVKFPNTKAYLSHLGGKNHELVTQTFHSRSVAAMNVLLAESKLACKKVPTKVTGARRCYSCECTVGGSMESHKQTIEHMLVSRYMDGNCCGHHYDGRANAEEHRLSLRHLKNQMTMEEERKEKERKEMEKKIEEWMEEEKLKKGEVDTELEMNEGEEIESKEMKKEDSKGEKEMETDLKTEVKTEDEAKEKADDKKEEEKNTQVKEEEKDPEEEKEVEKELTEEERKALEEKEKTPEEKQKEKEEEDRKAKAAEAFFHKKVQELWQTHKPENVENEEDPDTTLSKLPPYDPDNPIGLEYLYREVEYWCDVCQLDIRSIQQAKYHFRSTDHYHAITRHLSIQMEEEELLEKKKQDEEDAARRQRREAEGEDGGSAALEDDHEDDLHNMETVDEAGEDIDLDATVATFSDNHDEDAEDHPDDEVTSTLSKEGHREGENEDDETLEHGEEQEEDDERIVEEEEVGEEEIAEENEEEHYDDEEEEHRGYEEDEDEMEDSGVGRSYIEKTDEGNENEDEAME